MCPCWIDHVENSNSSKWNNFVLIPEIRMLTDESEASRTRKQSDTGYTNNLCLMQKHLFALLLEHAEAQIAKLRDEHLQ